MKQVRLFEALEGIGDDLLEQARNKRFPNPWRRWGKIAACLALVLCLTALALPYFPIGCGSAKSEAPMADASGANEKADTTEMASPAEKPEVSAEEPEMPAAEENDGAEKSMTKFVVCGTYYYLQPQFTTPLDQPPRELGEELGTVTSADLPELVGCTVYKEQYSAVFDRYAVDGQAVTQNVFVKTAEGYVCATTENEKIVSRYSFADVEQAVEDGNADWLLETFVLPLEAHGRGELQFTDASQLTADQLNRLIPAFAFMNMGSTVVDLWAEDGQLVIPVSDARFRLERFLTGFTYAPLGTEAYDPDRNAVILPREAANLDESVQLTLEDAILSDANTLCLTVLRQDGVRREYVIRFDTDSWRYLQITAQ